MNLWDSVEMVAPTAHTTQQTFLIVLFPEMDFSLVMMLMLITNMIPPNTIFTTGTPHTYICVRHLTFCWRIFNHTILKVQYRTQKPGSMPSLGIV